MKFLKENLELFDVDAYALRGKFFYKNLLDSRARTLSLHKEEIQGMDFFKCPLCRDTNGEIYLEWEEHYTLLRCKSCGAVSPNISVKDAKSHISSLYDSEDYYKNVLNSIHNQYGYRKQLFGESRYEYIISRLNLDPKKISILDVGCGAGYFLSVLQDREVKNKGLEVTPYLVRYCRETGLNVSSTELFEEEDEAYDVITLFDVLEHLANPIDIFKIIRKKLNRNGYCVVFTPNIHSVGFELMGAKQNLLVPFEHVCFYNDTALDYLAHQSELEVFSIENYGLDIMDYLLMKEYEDNIQYTTNLHEMMILIQAILDKAKVSNHLRITFQKK